MFSELSLSYWGVMRKMTQLRKQPARQNYFSRMMRHRQRASAHSWESTWVLSLMQCCPSPEMGRFPVQCLCCWLIGKGTSGGGFIDKEFLNFREAITVLGYQLQNEDI
jgi:hypothetical protein